MVSIGNSSFPGIPPANEIISGAVARLIRSRISDERRLATLLAKRDIVVNVNNETNVTNVMITVGKYRVATVVSFLFFRATPSLEEYSRPGLPPRQRHYLKTRTCNPR